LSNKKKEKYNQEEHRCKRSEHPTTFVDKNYYCSQYWKCPEKESEGCIAKG